MEPILNILMEPTLNVKLAPNATSREALIRYLAESSDFIITPEGDHISHASMTIFNGELTVFLGYQNIDLMTNLIDWFDCPRIFEYRTKHAGTDRITNVWVNLIAATTPSLLQAAVPLETAGSGLLRRLLFIYQSEDKIVPIPYETEETLALHKKLVSDIEDISLLSGTFRCTEEFVKDWISWRYDTADERPFEDLRFTGYFKTRPVFILKLSMILSAARSNDLVIESKDMIKAISFLTEAEALMPMALGSLGKNANVTTLNMMMTEVAAKGTCTIAQLMRLFKHDIQKWELDKMLETLEAMGFCTYLPNTKRVVYNREFHKKGK
jgi:hypothetical protein